MLSALVGSAAVLSPSSLFAQEAAAAAQLLFEQGRDLLRAGRADQACPKLHESHRLGPATGTLLALAMCHEAQGKLATAWAEYTEVVIRAAREGQTTREAHARAKVLELKPRLSSHEVRISAEVAAYPGLELRRNGLLLGQAAWNTPVPVDGGDYELQVSAPEREVWRHTVSIAPERDVVVTEVPELGAVAIASAAGAPSAVASGSSAPKAESVGAAAGGDASKTNPLLVEPKTDTGDSSALAWSGLAIGGFGVATWIVGAGFFAVAYDHKLEYERPCTAADLACQLDREDHHRKAWDYGNWATGLGIGGGVLLITGGILYLLQEEPNPSNSSRLHVDVGRDQAIIGVTGAL